MIITVLVTIYVIIAVLAFSFTAGYGASPPKVKLILKLMALAIVWPASLTFWYARMEREKDSKAKAMKGEHADLKERVTKKLNRNGSDKPSVSMEPIKDRYTVEGHYIIDSMTGLEFGIYTPSKTYHSGGCQPDLLAAKTLAEQLNYGWRILAHAPEGAKVK